MFNVFAVACHNLRKNLGSEKALKPLIYQGFLDIKKMNKLLEMLDDDDDVQNTYHNWDE